MEEKNLKNYCIKKKKFKVNHLAKVIEDLTVLVRMIRNSFHFSKGSLSKPPVFCQV